MDINTYALEILARDRLDRARAPAVARRGTRQDRTPLRVGLGLALIGLGRWLRGAEARPRRELAPA